MPNNKVYESPSIPGKPFNVYNTIKNDDSYLMMILTKSMAHLLKLSVITHPS